MNKLMLATLFYILFSHESLAMFNQEENIPITSIKLPQDVEELLGREEGNLFLGMINFKSGKFDTALSYLNNAAEFDNGKAEYVIGRIYEFEDPYRNYKEAEFWYELAESHGNKRAHEARERINIKKNKYDFVSKFYNYFIESDVKKPH